jgi:molybdate/tungstate transport system substrate-binding protein
MMVDIFRKGRSQRFGALLSLSFLALGAAACGSSAPSRGSGSGGSSGAAAPSSVNVAYAASLAYLNEKIVGPAFQSADGLKYVGRAGPSDGLSKEILSGEITPDVFESVGGDPIKALEPKFTSWYVSFATTSIVLAFNPKSKYAPQFEAIKSGKKPITALFPLLETKGLKLGRTDPNLDPQGRAFIFMLMLAQSKYHLPADTVSKIIGTTDVASADASQIFDEAALEPRLQAGQLDAASAYESQAIQLHLDYIKLPDAINLSDSALKDDYAKATMTITGGVSKHGSPLVIDITTINKSAAGAKFAAYVLSQAGLNLHKQGGYTLLTPKLTGSGAPAAVQSELGG